jgi:hypothetical protein
MRQTYITHQLVEFIPEHLGEGVLYISQQYRTAAHLCCCGCGKEIITPLTPTDWALRIDEGKVTLSPSIGNWSLACQSHYWIKRNKVVWAGKMSQRQIELGRKIDCATKQRYFEALNHQKASHSGSPANRMSSPSGEIGMFHSLWKVIKRWWKSLE